MIPDRPCEFSDQLSLWNHTEFLGESFDDSWTDSEEQCFERCLADEKCLIFSKSFKTLMIQNIRLEKFSIQNIRLEKFSIKRFVRPAHFYP